MARREEKREGGGTTSRRQESPTTAQRDITTEQERPVRSTREDRPGSGLARTGMYEPTSYPFTPLSMVQRLSEDFDRLLNNLGMGRASFAPITPGRGFLSGSDTPFRLGVGGTWSPQIDVIERGDNLVVRADLPGLRKEDVNIDVQDDALTIQGERREEYEDTREGVFMSERSYGRFFRSIPLPDGVNPDDVNAKFSDGVLEITMPRPKQQTRRGKRIEIR
jgi:HSP20 family protein